MTTMTAERPAIDLAALGAAVAAQLARNAEPEPEPAAEPEWVYAQRVTMSEAKRHFDRGGTVLVSEHGYQASVRVTPSSVVHNQECTTWKALTDQVREWRHRYPRQRFYIVPGTETPEPDPAPPAEPPSDRQSFAIPRVEAAATMVEAITSAVESVLTGNHKATVQKRKALIAALCKEVAEVPIYGIDIDGARLPIGDGYDLDNCVIETDGDGRAVRITVDAGTPIWDVQ